MKIDVEKEKKRIIEYQKKNRELMLRLNPNEPFDFRREYNTNVSLREKKFKQKKRFKERFIENFDYFAEDLRTKRLNERVNQYWKDRRNSFYCGSVNGLKKT